MEEGCHGDGERPECRVDGDPWVSSRRGRRHSDNETGGRGRRSDAPLLRRKENRRLVTRSQGLRSPVSRVPLSLPLDRTTFSNLWVDRSVSGRRGQWTRGPSRPPVVRPAVIHRPGPFPGLRRRLKS